jgi:pimeloyl-ACP methyl ester carboxylesterase
MPAKNGSSQAPDTIVLIHGLWMTPRSWEHWIPRYERHGYRVLAPAYPGFEVEVEALRADPTPIENATIEGVTEYFEGIIRGLDKPPILIGHSFGGTIVQLLLDRGLGAVGVAVNSALVKGIRVVPLSQIRSLFTFLDNPAHRHQAVGFTPKQFHYAFTNVISEEESQAAYDRYHIPAPGRIIWDGVLANFSPNSPAKVDFKKVDRPPLLFIAGGEDHIMPPAVNQSNYKKYRKNGVPVDYVEFANRSHFMVGQHDWESIADMALSWAVNHTAPLPVSKAAASA